MSKTLRDQLDTLVKSKKFVSINDTEVKVCSWEVKGVNAILNVEDPKGSRFEITKDMDELSSEISTIKVVPSYTARSLRESLIDQIKGIESGELDVSKAKAISTHVQTVINITKLELDYKKAVNNQKIKDDQLFLEG